MKEYIERAVALEALSKSGVTCNMRAHKIVASIQAADVAPVVHGKWLDEDFPEEIATEHGFAICSACGELSHKAEHGYNILSKYCPNCGAKMDGKS